METTTKQTAAERAAEHVKKIYEMVEYLKTTPVDQQPTDRIIYRDYDSSALGLERARYVLKHGVSAEEAVRISNAEKRAKQVDSLRLESMAGKCGLSLEWLTRSFKVAA